MSKYNGLLKTEFFPPNTWILTSTLTFSVEDVTEVFKFKELGVIITDQAVIEVPKGFTCDLASVPRILWWLVSPFDVARAAVIHDVLYGALRKHKDLLDKKEFEQLRKIADSVFKEAMHASVPTIPEWKVNVCYNAVRIFGRYVF